MRSSIIKFIKMFILIFVLYSCTDSIYMENNIPVSSDELIDSDVIYKSSTEPVEVEKLTDLENSKENNNLSPKQIIISPEFKEDEIVNSTKDNYNEQKDLELKNQSLESVAENTSSSDSLTENTNIQSINSDDENNDISITYLSAVIYHSHAKSDLQGKEKLEKIASIAKNKNAIIHVVGHSSSRTNDTSVINNKIKNFKMSLRRAETTRNYLVSLGVHPNKIFITAASDTEKIAEEDIPINEALNRRTEIYLSY